MFALLLACVQSSPLYELADPSADGPYAVGRATTNIDDDRGGTLTVDVWFPASRAGEPTPYSPAVVTGLASTDADRAEGTFPLVAFSHGNGGIRFQTWFVLERLASLGFVVVAPDHPNNTLFDFDPDLMGEVYARRPGDVRRAADWAMATYETEESYLVMGHSFGGWTTLAVAGGELDGEWMAEYCAAGGEGLLCDSELPTGPLEDSPDPRAYGGVAMTPCGWYTFGESGLSGAENIAIMGAGQDDICPYDTEAEPAHSRLGEPKGLYNVETGGHFIYSMMCELGPIQEECDNPDYAQTAEAWPGIKQYAAAWALRVWSGDGAYDQWL